ncbi:ABC transporter substrate-binding protein [Herbiconiux sp. 11R-BC]|uniref:ABC transporter substrate-binding protein n=1 Tax=Herbiconiux sp. 11R-BC TaxID=3111637 RepID=UPI003BFBB951
MSVPLRSLFAPHGARRGATVLALAATVALVCAGCSADAGSTPAPGSPCRTSTPTSTDATPAAEAPPAALVRGDALLLGSIGNGSAEAAAVAAGVALAAREIDESPTGVLGGNLRVIGSATADAGSVLTQGATAVVGPSSPDTAAAVNQVTSAGAVFASATDTAIDRSVYTAPASAPSFVPSAALQASALAQQLTHGGASTVGVIAVDDAYGAAVSAAFTTALQAAGGTVSANALVSPSGSFAAAADAVGASAPDAVVVISHALDQGGLDSLLAAGRIAPASLHLLDQSAADYSGVAAGGALDCAAGVRAGVTADAQFLGQLAGIAPGLSSTRFAAEAHDAVIAIALAANAAGDPAGAAIAAQLPIVTNEGTRCTAYDECAQLQAAGVDIDFDGLTGPLSLSADGVEQAGSAAAVLYGADGAPATIGTVFGSFTPAK